MTKRRWLVAPRALSSALGRLAEFPPLLAQIFINRGVIEPQEARRFLARDTRTIDPMLMRGMAAAVDRLHCAISKGEPIAVYGDFDADGVCATALLSETLKSLGGKVLPYIPHRINEGYGLNGDALRDLKEKGARVVVTVDCGIRSLPEVELGNQYGLDMIVTDHHSVGPELPRAVAVVNPKQPGDEYPFKELAGVGVAFRLAQALLAWSGPGLPAGARPLREEQLIDLVALGTVADLVPLVGENRSLVQAGLERLNATERPGLQALMQQAGARGRKIDAGAISYFLGPRLNAAGRIEHARTAYKLLTTQYPGEADDLASKMEAINRERQRMTEELVIKAREMIAGQAANELILMAGSTEFPEGIIGLIASKLSEESYRPAIALAYNDQHRRGSARSIPEFNIVAALDECADCLVRHGGHAAAAGFTVENGHFEELISRLRRIAERELGHLELAPTIAIDAEAELGDMNWSLLGMLEQLAPFGYGNREPVFLTRGATVRAARIVGTEHLSLTLTDGVIVWDAIAFRQKEHFAALSQLPKKVDVVYTLSSKVWQGEPRLQLEVRDLQISA